MGTYDPEGNIVYVLTNEKIIRIIDYNKKTY